MYLIFITYVHIWWVHLWSRTFNGWSIIKKVAFRVYYNESKLTLKCYRIIINMLGFGGCRGRAEGTQWLKRHTKREGMMHCRLILWKLVNLIKSDWLNPIENYWICSNKIVRESSYRTWLKIVDVIATYLNLSDVQLIFLRLKERTITLQNLPSFSISHFADLVIKL